MEATPQSYDQARAAEELSALLAHLPYARPLLGHCVVPLRWAHELELTLSANAFFSGQAPLLGDVFELLWRLDPVFTTGDGRLPNLPAGAVIPSRWTRFRLRVRLWRFCQRLDLHRAEVAVRAWLAVQRQDAPHSTTDDGAGESGAITYNPRIAERVNQFDAVALHFSTTCGYTPEQILQLGVAWTWQHMRAADLSSGDAKRMNRWIRPSADLLTFEAPVASMPQSSAG